jgi:hypothetical protein
MTTASLTGESHYEIDYKRPTNGGNGWKRESLQALPKSDFYSKKYLYDNLDYGDSPNG